MSKNSSNAPDVPTPQMNIRKRDGSLELVNLTKIIKAVTRAAAGIENVDPACVAVKTIGGLYDGATTQYLDELSIETVARSMVRILFSAMRLHGATIKYTVADLP